MKTHTGYNDSYYVDLHSDDLVSLKTYLKASGLEFNKITIKKFSDNQKDQSAYDLIGNIKQLYKFVSDLIPNKSVRITVNKNGDIKEITINGFNKEDIIEILKYSQSIYVSKKT